MNAILVETQIKTYMLEYLVLLFHLVLIKMSKTKYLNI